MYDDATADWEDPTEDMRVWDRFREAGGDVPNVRALDGEGDDVWDIGKSRDDERGQSGSKENPVVLDD